MHNTFKITTLIILALLVTQTESVQARTVPVRLTASFTKNDMIDLGSFKKTVTCYKKSINMSLAYLAKALSIKKPFFNATEKYTVKSYKYLVDDNGSVADFDSIQDAIDASADGDRIYVCPGTYDEQITVDKDVKLIGLAGANTTFIDASTLGDGTVVTVAASALIQGFTITGAKADFYCYYGGGIKITGASGQTTNYPIIQNNKIIDNVACKVGGIYLSGFGSANGETVYNTAIIRNNIIAGNYANTSNAGGIMVGCNFSVDSVIENNVIAYNDTAASNGAIQTTGTGCYTDFRNNIIYGNTSSDNSSVVSDYSGGSTYDYNCYYDNSAISLSGTGNSQTNPLFVDEVNYRLNSSSPCANAGDPDSNYDDVDGSRNDIGAYGGPQGDW